MLNDYVNNIVNGDSFELIKNIPDKSINLVVTSPPYFNQREYTDGNIAEIGREETLDEYVDKLLSLFRDCVRVTKDDGHIIFNLGDKYIDNSLLLVPYHFAIRAINSTNVKLVNNLTWVKTNPTPRQSKRRLVSSTEPFFDFVKSDNYYYNSVFFDEERKTAKKSERIGLSYFKQIDESSLSLEQKELARKELADAIEEVKAGKIYSLRMKIIGKHSLPFGGQQGGRLTHLKTKGFTLIKIPGRSMKKDVFECPVETIRGIQHPAIYPQQIIEFLLKITTKEDDLVFDPFMGAGTTAIVCKKMNRKFIGFDLCQKYVTQSLNRLSKI